MSKPYATLNFSQTLDYNPDEIYAGKFYAYNYLGQIECWHVLCKLESKDNGTQILVNHALLQAHATVLHPIARQKSEGAADIIDYVCDPYLLRYLREDTEREGISVYDVVFLPYYNEAREEVVVGINDEVLGAS